jgi:DNA mismatch endonuclease, patch repair protein
MSRLKVSRGASTRRMIPSASSAAVRSSMLGNRGSNTLPEMRLRRALHHRGLRFRVNYGVQAHRRVRPDIVFTKAKVAVFVDGCFWHHCPDHGSFPSRNRTFWSAKLRRNIQRDRRTNRALEAAGWVVLRVWEHEVSADVHALADRIAKAVLSR